jgi:tRNA(fMet)-specific endonuclease VapC
VFILDTDHVSLLERGESRESDRLKARLNGLDDADVAVTIITFEEQARGWLAYLARARNLSKQVDAYARLRRLVENYRFIPLLDFDAKAAAEFQRLSNARPRIGSMDLKIASIALANGATLVSRNLGDFRRVPGLVVEDWST